MLMWTVFSISDVPSVIFHLSSWYYDPLSYTAITFVEKKFGHLDLHNKGLLGN